MAIISSRDAGNRNRLINHSCNASARFKPLTIGQRTVMIVQAIRDIPAFEEITVNYGRDYWMSRWKTCQCGEPNCFSLQLGRW